MIALAFVLPLSWASHLAAQDFATKQKPLRADGSAQLRYSSYQSKRSAFPANAVYLTASPTVYLYGVAIPVSVTLSNLGVDFRQPFNRFSFKPRYKWAEAQLGWVNPRYSEFTMAGYTMLGGGVSLTPGKWEISASYGRLNRATTIDTLAGELNPESFDRLGYAGRLRFGTERAKVYVTFFSAEDQPESLQFAEARGRPELLDVEPAANTATSLGFSVPFGKTLTLEAEGAVSVFTENLAIDGTEIDSAAADLGVPEFVTDLVAANASTDFYPALSGKLEYASPGPAAVTAAVSYRRVAPNYRTMGAFFFQNDLENIVLTTGFKPFKALRVRGSIGRQRDNLNGIKAATSERVIGSARADLRVKSFATSLDFYNYSNDQTPRIAVIGDSLRIASTNRSLSLSPSYSIQSERLVHVIAATASRSSVRDFVGGLSDGAAFRDLNTDLVTATYSVTLLASTTTIGLTGTFTSLAADGQDPGPNDYRSRGLNLSVSQAFAKGKGSVSVSGGLFGQTSADVPDGQQPLSTAGLNAGYRLGKRVRFNTSFQYSGGPATGRLALTESRFTDLRIDTRVSYRL